MTPEHEINRLNERIDRLETVWLGEIKEINTKLTTMAVATASKHECPAPGTCVFLKADMERATARLNNHGDRIAELERFRYAAIVIFTIISALLTLFGPSIRSHLGL